jgi:translation elongation factor EF-Tu-like GTPase
MPVPLLEIIAKKRILDKKIKELKKVIVREQNNDLVEELIALLEMRQSHMLSIEAANNASQIKLGGTPVNIAAAIQLRKTIKEKIDILTSLIENPESKLDILALQKQRDNYYDEYVVLSGGITRNDLEVTIG